MTKVWSMENVFWAAANKDSDKDICKDRFHMAYKRKWFVVCIAIKSMNDECKKGCSIMSLPQVKFMLLSHWGR